MKYQYFDLIKDGYSVDIKDACRVVIRKGRYLQTVTCQEYIIMRSVIVAFLFAYSFCVSAETVNLNNSSVRSFVQWYSSKTASLLLLILILKET
ncbi:general secretion pathway protein D [Escherichia coli]|nr:hypothetical protein [Escherichia coli]STS15693.1 general secretion pathway protein D [Escherichia coli]